ncbi:MAG: AarF/ABC1/UbiB kinase family protein [Acidobacteria bacterium]|nr:AarF/ABC1/UbiB kinase family protein [Acidobacteriota bacterium]
MSRVRTLIDYSARLLQVTGTVVRFGSHALYRRVTGRPVEGPALLREFFEAAGGAFIKFGQILSLQIDTLPREYCDALLSLLDRVPPVPREVVDQVFQEELGSTPGALYQEFNYTPIASASIGQVHRAQAVDGGAVAVKVQRPGVRTAFERDNLLLRSFVRFIFFFRIRRLYFMRDPVRELGSWTEDELDYRREAAYCQLLGDNAVETPTERVPKIYWDRTAGRVLTMEFLEGPSVAAYLRILEANDTEQINALKAKGFDSPVFVGNVITNFLSDAFRFGVFHADLHPANLLILPGNVVGYVDFGIVAVLTPEARRKQIELTLAYSSGDPQAIFDAFLNICMVSESADLRGMRRRMEQLTRDWYAEPAVGGKVRFRVTVTKAMMDLLSVCQDYGVLVDREMIKYIRSTILADGLVSRLARDFDLAKALRTVVEDYMAREARQKVLSQGGAMSMLADLILWLDAGPAAFLHALNLFERRQIRVRADLKTGAGRGAALRNRAVAVAAVWAAAVLYFGLGGADPWRASPVYAGVAGGFLVLWTGWLFRVLLQLR